ncbi:MAG: TatD family hydrolase [Bacteroidales bacterium]|nr:TatD family hydrolase [Bacteroidales bacterium]
MLTDTHTHLYLDAFDEDRQKVVENAMNNGVKYMLLPNINSDSAESLIKLCDQFPDNCFPMMGLHPTSVKENYKEELDLVTEWHEQERFVAVGEIGIDLYWDKTFQKQQEEAFRFQIELSLKRNLPIVIHSRESIDETVNVLKDYKNTGLKGVFHCFTGNVVQANEVIEMGFMLGIGGVVTFKNSGLAETISQIDMKYILLETDSPFLAPMPFRGKRNESAYTRIIAQKIADIKNTNLTEVAEITTENAKRLFNLPINEQ